jgi:hypothetical protein
MRRDRGIGGQLLSASRDPVPANIRAQARIPRYQDRDQVGHRRTRDEEPARCRGKVEQGSHPVGHLAFDLQRDLVPAPNIRVQPGGQHLRQHAYRSSAALHPAQKTWVRIARRKWQNAAHEFFVNLRQRRGLGGKTFAKTRPNLIRDHLPHRKFAHGFHVPEHVVEHVVGLLAKAGPVVRVKRTACRRSRRGLVCCAAVVQLFAGFVLSQRGLPNAAACSPSAVRAIGRPCIATPSHTALI